MKNTRLPLLVKAFEAQRQAFAADPFPDLPTRLSRLTRLGQLVEQHEAELTAAISADFGNRSSHETRIAELFLIRAGLAHAKAHLKKWMTPRRVPTDLHFQPGSNRLMPQPLGVVGIVSPWNYPVQLALGPATAALAAGNRVIIKPSELTPKTSALLAKLVEQHFEPIEMCVVQGDAAVGRAFVGMPWDHLFFTGSTAVGKEVAKMAAEHLTPLTLELGGKSPAIVDASADMAAAAKSIAYGKLLNAGQTCVAPDHVLVAKGHGATLTQGIEAAMAKLYPSLLRNPDYTSIVSPRHLERLRALVQEAKSQGAVVIEVNPKRENLSRSKKMPPTLVLGATPQMRLMQEEIFGPVLPIVEVKNLDEAIARVNTGPKPLALYWFGRSAKAQKRVLQETQSGGVTINDTLWHLAQEHQPFGGLGPSGSGAYHGIWGFNTFSQLKPVFTQHPLNAAALTLFHPPYGKTFEGLLRALKFMH